MRMFMKTALMTVLLSGSALAADLPARYSAPPPVPALPSYFSWSGFYVGAQAGYSFEKDKTKEFFTAGRNYTGVAFEYHPDSGLIGGHAGFNYQIGALVLGMEGDLEALRARGGFNDPGGRSPIDPGGVGNVRRDWQGSVRGRIGYAMDRMMIYATGGAAFTEFNYSFYNPVIRMSESTKRTRDGWTVGLGVNYALTDNIILGLEYRHTDYGKFDYVAQSAFLGLTGQQSPTSDAVRASVAYKF